MTDELNALVVLNQRIGDAEERGDREFLDSILAPALAFRRADPAGTVVDRTTFLDGVKPGMRRSTEVESVVRVGESRALVTCIVTAGMTGTAKRFHNLRLFVRVGEEWKLLAWADEPLT